MAIGMCVMGVLGIFLAVMALSGGKQQHALSGPYDGVRRTTSRVLTTFSHARLTSLMLCIPSWRRVSLYLAPMLSRFGVPSTEQSACAAIELGVVALALVGWLVSSSVLGCVVGLVLAGIAVPTYDGICERRKKSALLKEMPEVFRTLSVALSSGQTLTQAINYVGSEGDGAAARIFSQAALRLSCGYGMEEVVSSISDALDAPGSELLSIALVISHRTGSPLKSLFQRSARLVERAGESERMLSVKTAQVRLSVRVVCLLPVVMLSLLSLLSHDFRAGLMTPVGAGCVFAATLMDVAAVLIIRSLVRGILR